MANEVFREPDENSGPAIANREPVVLPKQRKRLVNEVRKRLE